ncbi:MULTISPECIES: response regulator transcription factor [Metabacillus]|jgi:DNA-binding NarL/FixJ family response regulator|uniref:Response regulator transcription factor n=1 Tax=Metabacillus rhizolycopersici TaxID=2875709 RepID=A0ABS7UWE5_9BACI|nr:MULTISPECIES: response regulator transcription factor [Metabacillus]MBZ5752608.1 response regulator transcription factor [Metabacillus rhizolycopersici]MCM3654287.1 response regulator transcription factor [Metabacillus litoralis]
MDQRIKVLLVEDDPFWRETLVNDLNQENDIEMVGIALTQEEAVAAVHTQDIDVILMDINLTGNHLDGLEATREISRYQKGQIKIIMLTSFYEKDIILDSFRKGAVNYITKHNYQDIVNAIRDAYTNEANIHSDAAGVLRNEIQLSVLTPMEREVYELKKQGLNKTQIAERLFKSINTIKSQIRSIRNKLM